MRCFVAAWPPREVTAQLDHIAATLHADAPRARRIAPEDLHLTLAFIGELHSSQIDPVVEALRAVTVEPFDWQIDHVGTFRSARVAWVGGAPASRLSSLADRVRGALDRLGISYDKKPFVAHVTLLRKFDAPRPLIPIEPLRWPIGPPMLAAAAPAGDVGTRYRRLS